MVNLSQISAQALFAIRVPAPAFSAHTNIPLATDLKETPQEFGTTQKSSQGPTFSLLAISGELPEFSEETYLLFANDLIAILPYS